ncbi:MAG TPA: hypothetical protein VF787_03280 [Thermoanaerobaculia bacterium]
MALTVGTAVSTNAYDLGADAVASATRRDPTIGQPIATVLSVGVAAVTSGGETYEFDAIQADDAALTVNKEILAKYAFTNAQSAAILVAGAIVVFPWPTGTITRRYIGMQAVLAVGTAAVTVTAWIAPQHMVQMSRAYATLIKVL